MTTGAMAAKVCGRFRGKGRYVSAWVNWWSNTDKPKPNPKRPFPDFKTLDIDDVFIKRHSLQTVFLCLSG